MQFKLKSFKKKAYLFDPSELASKEAFKTAVHGFLGTSWTAEEIKAELPEEGQKLVAEWVTKIDAAIDEMDPECFPIDENKLDLLWMESSDVWDGIDEGDYSDLNMLFQGFVNSLANGDCDFDAATDGRKATEKCQDCGVEAGQDHLEWCNSAEITKKTFPNQSEAMAEGGEKKYHYKCDECGKEFECYQCLPRPMSRVCDTCEDGIPREPDFDYNAETKTAKFRLKSYHPEHTYAPEVDEVGTFWVVTKPVTPRSENIDICFRSSVGAMMLQSQGNLPINEVLGVYAENHQEAALAHAQRLIEEIRAKAIPPVDAPGAPFEDTFKRLNL
jgi:hypothetical protein